MACRAAARQAGLPKRAAVSPTPAPAISFSRHSETKTGVSATRKPTLEPLCCSRRFSSNEYFSEVNRLLKLVRNFEIKHLSSQERLSNNRAETLQTTMPKPRANGKYRPLCPLCTRSRPDTYHLALQRRPVKDLTKAINHPPVNLVRLLALQIRVVAHKWHKRLLLW